MQNQNQEKISLAQEIYEMTIKLNLETKRGEDSSELISKLKVCLRNFEDSFAIIRTAAHD